MKLGFGGGWLFTGMATGFTYLFLTLADLAQGLHIEL
jgi:hypothetical protein